MPKIRAYLYTCTMHSLTCSCALSWLMLWAKSNSVTVGWLPAALSDFSASASSSMVTCHAFVLCFRVDCNLYVSDLASRIRACNSAWRAWYSLVSCSFHFLGAQAVSPAPAFRKSWLILAWIDVWLVFALHWHCAHLILFSKRNGFYGSNFYTRYTNINKEKMCNWLAINLWASLACLVSFSCFCRYLLICRRLRFWAL